MASTIVGIDEAGRGPLAGRVYAAAVILDPSRPIEGLNDSKKISETERERLYHEIINNSSRYSVSYATPEEIDNINILQATFLAMRRALSSIEIDYDIVLVDGNQFPFKKSVNGEAIIKGDTKIREIMAASIIAKVTRDRYMEEMDSKYPNYLFKKHKGYPTTLHREIIKDLGPSPIHRKSFKGVKEYINISR